MATRRARLDESARDLQAVERVAAGGADVQARDFAQAERLLHGRRAARDEAVGRHRAEEQIINVLRLEPRVVERELQGFGGKRTRRRALRGPAAAADAGGLENLLGFEAEPLRYLFVTD